MAKTRSVNEWGRSKARSRYAEGGGLGGDWKNTVPPVYAEDRLKGPRQATEPALGSNAYKQAAAWEDDARKSDPSAEYAAGQVPKSNTMMSRED